MLFHQAVSPTCVEAPPTDFPYTVHSGGNANVKGSKENTPSNRNGHLNFTASDTTDEIHNSQIGQLLFYLLTLQLKSYVE